MCLSDKCMQWSNKNNVFYLKIELRYIEQNVKHQYSQIYRHEGRIGIFCEIIIYTIYIHPKVQIFSNLILELVEIFEFYWLLSVWMVAMYTTSIHH